MPVILPPSVRRARVTALQGAEQRIACLDMEQELRNIRAGWQFALEQQQFALIAHYLAPLRLYCDLRNQIVEGGESVFSGSHNADPPAANRLYPWGALHGEGGARRRASQPHRRVIGKPGVFPLRRHAYGRALWLCKMPWIYLPGNARRGAGVDAQTAGALCTRNKARSNRPTASLKDGLDICRQVGDHWTMIRTLNYLGLTGLLADHYSEPTLRYSAGCRSAGARRPARDGVVSRQSQLGRVPARPNR